jgi:lysophospholipase L1-like esterase
MKRLALAALALAAPACKNRAAFETKAVPDQPSTHVPTQPNNPARVAELEKRTGQIDAQVVFLGDSITEGWEGAGKAVWDANYAPLKALDYGVGGDKTQDVLRRIAVGHFDKLKPKVVVLMIGTNNTGTGSKPAEIADGVTAILQRLARRLPNTKILLLAIFPRGEKPDDPMRLNNEAANKLIEPLADGERVHYRDIGKVFLRDDGVLTPEIMPDMLHLSPKGYQLWAEAMDPELKRLLKG